MSDEGRDLLSARMALLQALKDRNYHFVTPTPLTHARVIARRTLARDLRDVLGWSLPFERNAIDPAVVRLLEEAVAVEESDGLLRSSVRVSSLGDDLFLHSAFPTAQHDAVFFGPDSYRFAAFVRSELPRFSLIGRIVDIGTGSGVGAVAAIRSAKIANLVLTDVNQRALDLAKANVSFASQNAPVAFQQTSALDGVEGPIHAIIANPPYIQDPSNRAYRDGGKMRGAAITLDWAKAAAKRLGQGGVLLLYTGSAIVGGEDQLKPALTEALAEFEIAYRELDPDVFGEELERGEYADVERIAVVGVVATKR